MYIDGQEYIVFTSGEECNKILVNNESLSPVIATHLGWNTQVGVDDETEMFHVVVNKVHQKDMPVSATGIDVPEIS